ncbi:M23 family metallopeptidase [Luteimonas gilva]|uniref:M23 family metallopeptidase n=1 Tax=Luteimonas gilva TaxID=2572684 RepID=A0A4U5JVB8_9GAMM|nr:M23 family metallopeptidase [Luteimonas gilva]TKR33006.1 M23 family metallopeptidase [Luteimonas gilva]
MRPSIAGCALLALAACAGSASQASDRITDLPAAASQGALVVGRTEPGNTVTIAGRRLRLSADGLFVLGIGRDQTGVARVDIVWPDGARESGNIKIVPRDWPIENIVGVPPKTVNPPPDIAARIEREQALVVAARRRDDDRADFAQAFAWPVQGRISGRFGNQRVYNGTPKTPHSGMDIAAPTGTPVKAPAGGIVTFAAPDLYLTGGTLLIDHGHGVSSNFLHLSRIEVKVGDRVEQGQVVAAVGATGRVTGPHLHWGMNWFEVRIDPLLVLERSGK